jgi:hypothetical protein
METHFFYLNNYLYCFIELRITFVYIPYIGNCFNPQPCGLEFSESTTKFPPNLHNNIMQQLRPKNIKETFWDSSKQVLPNNNIWPIGIFYCKILIESQTTHRLLFLYVILIEINKNKIRETYGNCTLNGSQCKLGWFLKILIGWSMEKTNWSS